MADQITKEEFCERFKAKMMTFHIWYDGTPEELATYAEEVAPTYWDEPTQREEGPEECARTDFSYWERD